MKITIDTKEDSHSEIEKAIRLLQALISGKERYSNIFEDSSPSSSESSGGLFNMFGDDSSIPKPEPPAVEEKEKKEDIPQIMEY